MLLFRHYQNQWLITCTKIRSVFFYFVHCFYLRVIMVQCGQPQMSLMLLCSLIKHHIEALHKHSSHLCYFNFQTMITIMINLGFNFYQIHILCRCIAVPDCLESSPILFLCTAGSGQRGNWARMTLKLKPSIKHRLWLSLIYTPAPHTHTQCLKKRWPAGNFLFSLLSSFFSSNI